VQLKDWACSRNREQNRLRAAPTRVAARSDRGRPGATADPGAYCAAVARLAAALGWPVLADGLNPLRNHATANPRWVVNYNAVLRSAAVRHG